MTALRDVVASLAGIRIGRNRYRATATGRAGIASAAAHMWHVIVNAGGGYNPAQMRDAARPTHADAIGLAQPVGLHALLRGDRVVAIENAIAVQQGCGGQHDHVAAI